LDPDYLAWQEDLQGEGDEHGRRGQDKTGVKMEKASAKTQITVFNIT
jgi:hypothetical protein